MTAHPQTASTPSPRRHWLLTTPAVGGIGFVAAWVIGLAVWPSNLDVAATGSHVVSAYGGHQGVAVTQYILVEGLAAVALALVVIALGQAAGQHHAEGLGRLAVIAGCGAVLVSLAECALGLVLTSMAVPDGESGRAGTLFHIINRLDGVKMLAFAVMALAGVGLASRGVLPRWLGYVAAALAVAMIVSGVGYLLLNNTVAQAAAASLLLLLIWVAATGVTLGRRTPAS